MESDVTPGQPGRVTPFRWLRAALEDGVDCLLFAANRKDLRMQSSAGAFNTALILLLVGGYFSVLVDFPSLAGAPAALVAFAAPALTVAALRFSVLPKVQYVTVAAAVPVLLIYGALPFLAWRLCLCLWLVAAWLWALFGPDGAYTPDD